MKSLINKRNLLIILITFIFLFLTHLPLMTKNILSADILLNNVFYNGYSWEISLGRFGLYVVGLLKCFLTIPHIDILISYFIISISLVILFDLFSFRKKEDIILYILIICLNPITSATLLFDYCSIGYTLAFLCSILSIYVYYKEENKIKKYLFSLILIVVALSMYQAYLSVIVTTFIIYNIKLLLEKKENFKLSLKYILTLLMGDLLYFIIMKISLLVFHVNMSNYSGADKIGLQTLLSIPKKIGLSYKLFYEYYFTDKIVKNIYIKNNILNIFLLILLIIEVVFQIFKNNLSPKKKVLTLLLVLALPIFLNSIIFTINDIKLQLLMSASYLLIPLLLITTMPENKMKYLSIIVIILLLRNNLIQTQATYLSLENTFNKYNTVITSAIKENINHQNYKFALIGSTKNETEINKLNYGFISDDAIFWEEYNLKKLGFERFCYEYYGLNLTFVSEEDYDKIKQRENKNQEIIYTYDDIIVIDLSYLH